MSRRSSSLATVTSSAALPKTGPGGRSIVVLGAGFGGITAALALREGLPREHRITLVDRHPTFMLGLRKQWLLTGTAKRADGERPLEALREKGVAAFDGKGYCFVETGDHRAFAIDGEFLASPAPSVTVAPPTAEGNEKKLERDRLARWF